MIEFDDYFVTQTGAAGEFEWSRDEAANAARWNLARLEHAVAQGISPIVWDDDCRPGRTIRAVVACGLAHGYQPELLEPQTIWWQAVRRLLDDAEANWPKLEEWASKLAGMNQATHGVHRREFIRRMRRWNPELRIEDLGP